MPAISTRPDAAGKAERYWVAGGDDGGGFAVAGVGADELGVEVRALGCGGESLVELGEELGGLGAMEVALGFGGFGVVLGLRRGAVEPEREDAVPVAGALVEGGDIAIEGEVAGAEGDGLVGRGEQQVDEAGEACLGGGFAGGQRARSGGEGEVVAGGFGVVVDGGGERGEGVEVCRGPGGVSGFAGDAEGVDGLLGLVEAALLLLVVEDAGEGVEGLGAVGVGGERGAGVGDEEALAMGLGEEREVRLDEVGWPERLEGLIVDGEGAGRSIFAAAKLEQGLGADGEDLILRERLFVAGDEGFGGGVVFLVELPGEGAGVGGGFGGVTGEQGVVGGGGFGGGKILLGDEREDAERGLPGALLAGVGKAFGYCGWGRGDLAEGGDLLRDFELAMIEVGEVELGGDGVFPGGLRVKGGELPVGFGGGEVEGGFVGAGAEGVEAGGAGGELG